MTSSCILYADDTTAKVVGEAWPEIELKLKRALNPLFLNMKKDRLKVNEDKTGLLVVGARKARRKISVRRRKGRNHPSRENHQSRSEEEVAGADNIRKYELDGPSE